MPFNTGRPHYGWGGPNQPGYPPGHPPAPGFHPGHPPPMVGGVVFYPVHPAYFYPPSPYPPTPEGPNVAEEAVQVVDESEIVPELPGEIVKLPYSKFRDFVNNINVPNFVLLGDIYGYK